MSYVFEDSDITEHLDGRTIVPHIREFVSEYIDLHEETMQNACRAYLAHNDHRVLHENMLITLARRAESAQNRVDWRQIIGTSLLATIHGFAGPPQEDREAFEHAIRDVMFDATDEQENIAYDIAIEEHWRDIDDDDPPPGLVDDDE